MISSLDTNVVLALLLNDRGVQQKAANELLQIKGCYISDLVFQEVEYVLRVDYGMDRQAIAHNITTLLSLPSVKCNTGLFLETLEIYTRCQALSFTDCCLAVEAGITRRTPLHTFDKKLASQSGGLAELLT